MTDIAALIPPAVDVQDLPTEHTFNEVPDLPEVIQESAHELEREHETLPQPDGDVETPAATTRRDRNRSRSRAAGERSPRARVTAKQVRTIIERHHAIAQLDEQAIAVVAAACNLPPKATADTATLTARLVADAPKAAGVRELREIRAAAHADDPFAAVVAATTHVATQRQQWNLLIALGAVEGALPGKELAAAAAITSAAAALGDEHFEYIEQVLSLAGAR